MKFERLEHIEQLLRQNGSVTVNELASQLAVSKETIRKDLDELASKNKIGRVHGGAYSFEFNSKVPYQAREQMLSDEKNNIAVYIANLIKDGSTIFIDSSTTAGRVLKVLITLNRKITVVTNSVDCIDAGLASPEIDVHVVGGSLDKDRKSFVTEYATDYERYNADYAIISPSGVDLKCGLTDRDSNIALMMKVFLKRAKQTFVVVDHSKMNTISPFSVGSLTDIDGIATDNVPNKLAWSESAGAHAFFFQEIQTKQS